MSAGELAADSVSGASETDTIAWSDRRLLAAMLLLVPAAVAAALWARPLGTPADLLAVWTAGEFWQMGRLDEIYPPASGLFTMLPPSGWVDWLAETQGYDESIYPFLYPPLWAVVMGTVAPSDFAPVAAASYWINAALLAATAILAVRATGALVNPVLHVVLVLVVFTTTQIASVGFLQGQPHIFVAFLIVLAVERSRAGAGATAGAALALAASIKLFPAMYVVIWLARGEKRAVWSFAVVGAALAAASVLLAGWPLHRMFLDSIGQIGRTLLVIGNNVSFDGVVGQVFALGKAELVRGANLDDLGNAREAWLVTERPGLWSVLSKAGLLAVLAGAALAARRLPTEALYAGLWPFLLTVSIVFTPTGWVYYIIPAAVFAPAMIAALPPVRGAALFFSGLLLFFSGRLSAVHDVETFPIAEAFVYAGGTLVWGLGFALTARKLAGE